MPEKKTLPPLTPVQEIGQAIRNWSNNLIGIDQGLQSNGNTRAKIQEIIEGFGPKLALDKQQTKALDEILAMKLNQGIDSERIEVLANLFYPKEATPKK